MAQSWLMFLTLVVASLVRAGGQHASVKSKYGQLVTSSTLTWKSVNTFDIKSDTIQLEDAVPSGTSGASKDSVVCRAEHHGTVVTGRTTSGAYCAIGFVNKVYKKEKFDILVNEDKAAKLEWIPYGKFLAVPEGAVAGVDMNSNTDHLFIGRHLSNQGEYLSGAIQVPLSSYSFGSMVAFDDSGRVLEVSRGDVMVEVEPKRYELLLKEKTETGSGLKPKVTRQDIVLAKSSLFRFDEGKDREARLQKVLSYDYEKSEYYGQIPGMIRALPATIKLSNGQIHSILWGLPEKSKQTETLMVGHALRHQTAVDVSVVGVLITEEHSYSADLTTVFPDGTRQHRQVSGVLQRRYLNNIRPEYSRVYRIKDSIIVSAKPDEITSRATPVDERHSTPWSPPQSQPHSPQFDSESQTYDGSRPKPRDLYGNSESQQAVMAPTSGSSKLGFQNWFAIFVFILPAALLWKV